MFRESCGQRLNRVVQGIFVVTLAVLLGEFFLAQDTLASSSNRASTYPSANVISTSLSCAGPILTAWERTPSCAFSCPLTQAEANRTTTAAAWAGISMTAIWCEERPDEIRPGYPAWVSVPAAATSITFSATIAGSHNGSAVNAGIARATPATVSSMAYKQVSEPRVELSCRQYCLWADQPS
jgi:hypothetical protein